MNLPSPQSPRQAVILLLIAALLLAAGLLASRRENFVSIPLMIAGAAVGVWGARSPSEKAADSSK